MTMTTGMRVVTTPAKRAQTVVSVVIGASAAVKTAAVTIAALLASAMRAVPVRGGTSRMAQAAALKAKLSRQRKIRSPAMTVMTAMIDPHGRNARPGQSGQNARREPSAVTMASRQSAARRVAVPPLEPMVTHRPKLRLHSMLLSCRRRSVSPLHRAMAMPRPRPG